MAITITGTSEDDVLTGGSGVEAFDGGDGFDFISYEGSDVGVTMSLDPETGGLSSDATGDTYTNVEGIIGSDNHDDLYGDNNDNIIQGGAGSDFIDGGYGYNDVALYEGNAADYTFENTARSEWSVTNNETGDTDTVEGIEVLTFDDTSAYDYAYAGEVSSSDEEESNTAITVAGTTEDDVLTSGSGVEAFDGGDGFDFISYEGSDVGVTMSLDPETGGLSSDAVGDTYTNVEGIIGSDNHDDLYGDNNDNIIQGGAGSDFIDGGYGYNDVALYEGNAADYTFENTARSEWTVTNNETGDTDTVVGIEVLTFDDTSAYDYAYAF